MRLYFVEVSNGKIRTNGNTGDVIREYKKVLLCGKKNGIYYNWITLDEVEDPIAAYIECPVLNTYPRFTSSL